MRRTKLKNRQLPVYTPEEEKWNMLTHIIGAVVALILGSMCILKAVFYSGALEITCVSIFVMSMLAVYVMSSIYHGIRQENAKKVLQVVDHCMIYFLIAGTYTPFLLCSLINVNRDGTIILLAFVWAFAILATVFTAIDLSEYKVFSMICYLLIGWCIIVFAKDIYTDLTLNGFILLFGGGVAYSVGAIFYGIAGLKHVKFAHCIFHLFTLIGTIMHAISILYYVL